MTKTFDELLYEETQEEVFLDVCLTEDGRLIDLVSKSSTLDEVLESASNYDVDDDDTDDDDDYEDERLFED